MKKIFSTVFLGFLLVFGAYSSASAISYLQDWNIDTAGTGLANGATVIDIWDLFNISGVGYAEIYGVNINPNNGPIDLTGTFSNWGVWRASSSDYVGESFPDINGDNTNDFELTGIYKFGGDAVLGGALTFKTGTLDIYLDNLTNVNYGTINDDGTIYGANDGLKIASFDLLYGTGNVSNTGEINLTNDNVNIAYSSFYLRPGYWVDASGKDLSTLNSINWLLGFSNTTAVTNPAQQGIIDELYTAYALLDGATQGPNFSPPQAVYMVNNGEFKIAVVPEPATMLLFGVGLLGLAGVSRKRLIK